MEKLQQFSLAPCCQIYRVTEDAEIAVWPIPFLINIFTALKGSQFYFINFLETQHPRLSPTGKGAVLQIPSPPSDEVRFLCLGP